MQLLPKLKAKVVLSDGSTLSITNTSVGVQLFWGLEGCVQGMQHYRYCTPHALKKPLSLNYFFCNYDEKLCAAEGRLQPPESELKLMQKLGHAGLAQRFCWQVTMPWWPAPVDFMLLSKKAVLQADGSSHSKSVYEESSGAKLASDLRFDVAGVQGGVSVIRVHDIQLRTWLHSDFLAKAVAIAETHCCIVLSVGYTTVCMHAEGHVLTYAQMLVRQLPGSYINHYAWGIVVICSK